MNVNEGKWWFVVLCFFLIGSMWGYILAFTQGTFFFTTYLLLGVVTAGVGLAFGRTARLLWDHTMPKSWKIRLRRTEYR